MSDQPTKGLRLFMNKPKALTPAAAGLSGALSAPKDVKKRWMLLGAGAIGVVVFGATVLAPAPPTRVAVEKEAGMVNVTPPNADKAAFESRFATDQESLRADLERMREEVTRLKALEAEGRNKVPPVGVTPPPVALGTNTSSLPSMGATPPSPPIPTFLPGNPSAPPEIPLVGALPPLSTSGTMGSTGSSTPLSFDAPAAPGAVAASAAPATAKLRLAKNASAGQMSIGFAPVALLNGVDAGTSSASQSNPLPVLMNLTDHATLPGSSKYRLKSCFVLGTAYGDLSAERVYARISRISCVDKKDRMVLNSEVQGYLVDSDGKLGLRGLISDRQGPRLAKALLAGFAQGLSGALGQAQGTVFSNLGTGDTTSSITGSAALRSSGLAGAQTATAQLAEFYLKEAQSIFPVITVDVGRTGTIVFTSPVRLEWADSESQYVPQVTPTN